jgi:ABC-2 type transport system permease protein
LVAEPEPLDLFEETVARSQLPTEMPPSTLPVFPQRSAPTESPDEELSAASPVPAEESEPILVAHPRPMRRTGSLSLSNALGAEWLKFSTIRVFWWLLLAVLVSTIAFTVIVAMQATTVNDQLAVGERPFPSADWYMQFHVSDTITPVVELTEFLWAIIGALWIAGETSSGMIRSTFIASPGRTQVFAAKGLLLGVFSFFGSALLSYLCVFAGWYLTRNFAIDNRFDFSMVSTLIGIGAANLFAAMLGFALGALVRNAMAAMAITAAFYLVFPSLTRLLPSDWSWAGGIEGYLPGQASYRLYALAETYSGNPAALDGLPSYSIAWMVCAAWALVPLVGGYIVYKRQDV